ncbi:MAG: HDIG domain-containing protein [Desulfobacterales bacterium]|nr:HDIG domain-containing protein [Desulfobacterales bacterium]
MKPIFHKNRLKDRPWIGQWGTLVLLVAVTSLLTIIVYPKIVIEQHRYELGDVAEKNVKASRDFFIEDREATRAKRDRAMENVLTVYDHDTTLLPRIIQRINRAFAEPRAVFEADLRHQVQDALDPTGDMNVTAEDRAAALSKAVGTKKETFETLLGIDISDGAYRLLEKEAFASEIETLLIRIVSDILENGVVANKEILLQESEKGIILRRIDTKSERPLNLPRRLYGLDQSKAMVRIIGQPLLEGLHYNPRNLIVDLVQRLIRPNITPNRNETEERKRLAAEAIKPILYKIKSGEMILREGERVTPVHLLKLKAMQAGGESVHSHTGMLGAALIILCLLTTFFILYANRHTGFAQNRVKNLLFISCALVATFFLARLTAGFADSIALNAPYSITASSIYFGIPLSAGAMTICLFLGLELALPFATVLAIGTAILFKSRFDLFVYFLISGAMAAYWVQNCRERKVFVKAGIKLGLLNVVLATAVVAHTQASPGISLFWDWAFAFMGGIGAGIVTAGVAPLVEIAFGYTTDIKLLELANLDQPILKRLMIEAPGTYHHSMIVGSLVEAAAAEIGANPLLAKVCGYYHDIGKINKPLYFIENQRDGVNRHDRLAPSMSRRILVSHVRDGVDMARKHKLGPVIMETIRQSHGTSLISYFYNKAVKASGEETVRMDDYRYPGPRPQTREAGLVMLADVVEAASRTLSNPTTARIQGQVQALINKIFSDGQLDNCELTLKDLHSIAKSFIKILNGIHHHRIEYPDDGTGHGTVKTGNGKGKNGHSDRQPPQASSDPDSTDSGNGTTHLRRLGQS